MPPPIITLAYSSTNTTVCSYIFLIVNTNAKSSFRAMRFHAAVEGEQSWVQLFQFIISILLQSICVTATNLEC
jgi:hypothetical protein